MVISRAKDVGGISALIAVLSCALTACSGGAASTAPNAGALVIALEQVQDNASTRTSVEFGQPDVALAANRRKLAGGAYGAAVGYGLGPLMDALSQTKQVFGFDPLRTVYAITAGDNLRTQGTLVFGQHLHVQPAKLRALGATRSGSTFRFAPDNQIITHGRLARELPGLIGLNVIRLDNDYLGFGGNAASVAQMQSTGSGLMGYAPTAAVASCLGNPLAAHIVNALPDIRRLVPGLQRLQRSGRFRGLRPTVGLQMVGVGLSGTAGTPPTEQMCVSEDSVQHANQVAADVRNTLHDGTSLLENRRWNTLLSSPSVRVHGTTVSLTAHPARGTGGVLLHAVIQGDLPGVYG